jgi:hypothetical protein
VSAAHSRGPAAPLCTGTADTRLGVDLQTLAEKDSELEVRAHGGPSQSSARLTERDSELVSRVESRDSECLRSVAADGEGLGRA